MIKKTSIFILSVFLLLLVFSAACVKPGEQIKLVEYGAAEQLAIRQSSVEAEFPARLDFNLLAESPVDINSVRLHYTVDRASYAQVTSDVSIEFVPDTRVAVSWALEMVKVGGLPPGASLEYWWTVEDVKGDKVATAPARVQFEDKRYTWQSLTEGKITIYWYQGGNPFATELMSAAQQTLARLTEETGAYLKKPVKLYVYASTQDLLGAMIYPQEWTGGVAFAPYGIIAIGISPSNLSWGKGAITHELTHLVIHQMTYNPYSELPTWLDEGLAMYAEGALGTDFLGYLKKAMAEDSLISVPSLSSPFSAYAEASYLSYAESYSLVEFLLTSYGQSKMLQLLTTFSQGSSYDGALSTVYGFDMDGLDTAWRSYAIKKYQVAKAKPAAISPAPVGTLARQPGWYPLLSVDNNFSP
ncbi:MAG: peptidase MA domain-containing protein [Chloroflexi bacterium]|nr:peptidase MA domain-containing protein [Chloroflexota bacterium]